MTNKVVVITLIVFTSFSFGIWLESFLAGVFMGNFLLTIALIRGFTKD